VTLGASIYVASTMIVWAFGEGRPLGPEFDVQSHSQAGPAQSPCKFSEQADRPEFQAARRVIRHTANARDCD